MVGGNFPWPYPTNFLLEVIRLMIPWNNTTNRIIYNDILGLLDDEFQWVADLGMDAYTLPITIEPAIHDRLDNSSNTGIRKQWNDFISLMMEEFEEVESKGYAYVVRTGVGAALKRAMDNIPNVTHRIAIFNVIDVYLREFALMEAAE